MSVLTGLVPILYKGFNRVARERVGFLHAVNYDAQASGAAVGQTVRSAYTQPATLSPITPSNVVPNTGSQTILFRDVLINQAFSAPIQWTGEEQRSVGSQYDYILENQAVECLRAITNNVEATLATVAFQGASRACGTSGATPFNGFVNAANAMHDLANTAQILDDNGAPLDERFLVLGSAAYNNLRSTPNLFKVNQAGTAQMLREGSVDQLEGFIIGYSGQLRTNVSVGSVTVGANIATQNVGDTVLLVTHGSAANLVSGDIVSFAGDPNQYVCAGNAAAGTITIQAPGLLQSFSANAAVSVAPAGIRNIGLHKNSIVLALRPPLMPAGGDAASDVELITDPWSGTTYQLALYKTYKQMHVEIGVAYGANVVKPEFISVLQG